MNGECKFIQAATEEILNPRFEITTQYLDVCELEYEDGKPKVARVNYNYFDEMVAVYFKVKDDNYFIGVHLTKSPKVEVNFIWTESAHKVYLTATSKEKCFRELASYIKLQPLEGWSVGERERFKGKDNDFTRLSYEPIKNEAYSLEEKLELLLLDLEKDKDGVIELANNSDAIISVCRYQYVSGNAGVHFDLKTINRLRKLNIGIDIDTYIVGNRIID